MRRERHHLHIGAVSEETGIDDGVSDVRKRGEHPIDKPKLARHQRRVVRSGEPLRKPDDLFEATLPRSRGKCRRTLDHERMVGRTDNMRAARRASRPSVGRDRRCRPQRSQRRGAGADRCVHRVRGRRHVRANLSLVAQWLPRPVFPVAPVIRIFGLIMAREEE